MEPTTTPTPEQTPQNQNPSDQQAGYTPPAPTTEPMQPQVTNAPLQPPKKKNPLLLILVIVLLLAGVGAAVWFLVLNKDDKPTTTQTNSQQTDEHNSDNHEHTTAELIEESVAALKAKYSEIDDSKIYSGEDNGAIAVFYEDIDAFVGLSAADNESGYVSASSYTSQDQKNMALLEEFTDLFLAEGFTVSDKKVFTKDEAYSRVLEKDAILCYFDAYDYMQLFFQCVDTSGLATAAEKIAPYYEAYRKSPEGQSAASDEYAISVEEDTLTKSQFSNYETIRGSIGEVFGSGANLTFWRKNTTDKTGDWNFAFGYQAPVNCEDYNTEDLQKAYVDSNCYDEDNPTSDDITVGDFYNLLP